jgi:hypothetical protein
VHHSRENIVAAHESPVKKDKPRRGHHEYKRGADEHPGVVTHVDRDNGRGRGRMDLEFRDHCSSRLVEGRAAAEAKKQEQEDQPGGLEDFHKAGCLNSFLRTHPLLLFS